MPPRSALNPLHDKRFDHHQDNLRQLVVRLEQAVATLQALPRESGTGPAGVRSTWPDMVRQSRFVIEGTRRSTGAKPCPEAIDDLDRVVMLMWSVTPRQLLWARTCGVRWAELCQRQRRSRTTRFRDHRMALAALARAEAKDSS